MKIFNKSSIFGTFVGNVGGVEYAIRPNVWTEVPDAIGAKLAKDYPSIISTVESITGVAASASASASAPKDAPAVTAKRRPGRPAKAAAPAVESPSPVAVIDTP
jgi:hypothetical protein